MEKNMKGQITVMGIMFGVVGLIVILVMLPVLHNVIDDVYSQLGTTEQLIVDLWPVFLVIAGILSILHYTRPRHEVVPVQ